MSDNDDSQAAEQHTPESPAALDTRDQVAEARLGKYERRLEPMLGVGVFVVVIGVIAGIVLALRAKVAPCEDGHYFPPGTTDFRCYDHPHAIIGSAMIGASVFAGIVLAIIAMTARLLVSELSSR